jgi:hypothetical protein
MLPELSNTNKMSLGSVAAQDNGDAANNISHSAASRKYAVIIYPSGRPYCPSLSGIA